MPEKAGSIDEWFAQDDAETDVWYRFRDLRDERPSLEAVAALGDARERARREASSRDLNG